MRRLATLGLLGILVISGCAPATDAPSSPSMSTPSVDAPSAAPTPEAPLISEIVITIDGIRVVDEEGVEQRSFGWTSEEADEAIAYLTQITGVNPSTSPHEGGFHDVDGTTYDWTGLQLTYSHGEPGEEPRGFRIRFSAATIGHLVLRTESGIRVGSTIPEMEAANGEPRSSSGGTVLYGVDQVTVEHDGQSDPEVRFVGAYTTDGGPVEWLQSPYSTYSA